MIKGGAEWLHMGTHHCSLSFSVASTNPETALLHSRCYGWVNFTEKTRDAILLIVLCIRHFVPNITMGELATWSPNYALRYLDRCRRTDSRVCVQRHTGNIHGLPHDGRAARKSEL